MFAAILKFFGIKPVNPIDVIVKDFVSIRDRLLAAATFHSSEAKRHKKVAADHTAQASADEVQAIRAAAIASNLAALTAPPTPSAISKAA